MPENEKEKRFLKWTVKDSVFSEIFTIPEYQVELLRALYPDLADITADDIEDVTIKNVVSTDVYNDLGLLFRDTLVVLVEAQSTMTANILVRFIEYVARIYKDHIIRTGQNWYDRPKVRIPRVDFYVVYVGAGEFPDDRQSINLRDEFFGGNPCGIDVRATVICQPLGQDALSQYIRFSWISNRTIAKYGRTRATAEMIIDECISEGILPGFFEERRQEVFSAMVELFSQEEAYEMMENAKLREGVAKGERAGRVKAMLASIQNLMGSMGLSADEAMNALRVSESERQTFRDMLKQ